MTTYVDDNGIELRERRLNDRTNCDPRIDHLFNGFDNVIHNADDYWKGYVQAMRKEFGELVAAMAQKGTT